MFHILRPTLGGPVPLALTLALAAAVMGFAPRGQDTGKSAGPTRSAHIDARAAAFQQGKHLGLRVTVRKGDTYRSLSKEFLGSEGRWKTLRAHSPGRALRVGATVRLPYAETADPWKRRVVEALFPADRYDPSRDGWVHKVLPYAQSGETLWRVAEWFTGEGSRHAALAEANAMKGDRLAAGQEILIPRDMLLAAFAEEGVRDQGLGVSKTKDAASSLAKPYPLNPNPMVMGEGHPELGYGQDAEGPYAAYRLKAGEALYSAVVVRFTGLLSADEVNRTALDVARRSGIRDVTDIPVGYAVKIPLDLLLPKYLPAGHPRRADYDAFQASVGEFRPSAAAEGLDGVYVLLDAGHGGLDGGAEHHGVHESDYVYDVMCRVHRLLATKTKASPVALVKNAEFGLAPRERDRLLRSRALEVLTTPSFRYDDPARRQMHVNLRWYLANHHYRRLLARGAAPENIVFVSVHADALHPSVRGAMVYVPGAAYAASSVGGHGQPYASRREVREHAVARVSAREKTRSQGYSHNFAQALVRSLRREGVLVHPYNPVRDSIVRRQGQPWSPAVLRNNLVPTKILFETANLANAEDAALMRTASFRESLARAFVDALHVHFSRERARQDFIGARRLASAANPQTPRGSPEEGRGRR